MNSISPQAYAQVYVTHVCTSSILKYTIETVNSVKLH